MRDGAIFPFFHLPFFWKRLSKSVWLTVRTQDIQGNNYVKIHQNGMYCNMRNNKYVYMKDNKTK